MSIISDALKKAQARRERKQEAADHIVDTTPPNKVSLESLPGATVPRMQGFLQNKRLIISLAGLIAIVLLGVFLFVILAGPTKRAVKTAQPTAAKTQRQPARQVTPTQQKPAAAKEVQPEQTETPQTGEPINFPIVGGIMYSPGHSQAIINGATVSEGDTVGGFRVKEILPSTVKVYHRGKEYELELR